MKSSYKTRNSYDETIKAVESTLVKLNSIQEAAHELKILIGFDGYQDELYRMVKNRKNLQEVEYYALMSEFGQKIIDIAGSSGSIERILKKKIGGGFSVNTARAISNMAPKSIIFLYGALGYPNIDPLFLTLPENVKYHTIGNFGITLAMEFEDGKIMSQDMGGIFELDWKTLIKRIGGRDRLIERVEQVDAIALGHWSLMIHMNDYFRYFIDDILPNISNPQKKFIFVDPADLSKRSDSDIREMLFLLKKLNYSFRYFYFLIFIWNGKFDIRNN